MSLNAAALQVGGNAIAADITHLSIHTALPDATGSNESTAARQPVSWTVVDGDLSATNISFTGGAASGPAAYVGYWTAVTGGSFRGYRQITTGDTAFNAAGEFTVDSITEDASAS